MKVKDKDVVTLCAVGDVAAFHKNPESAFEYVGPILREADITFAQNERHYGEEKGIKPQGGFTELTSPKHAEALKLGGFTVLSFASNHCMDMGSEMMLETVQVLKKLGFAVIGVGKNIEEARKPAIIERKGTKVSFLSYASVIRPGYEAGPKKAGCAPIRAWTLYHQLDYQPGTPPEILTFPYREDLAALIEDVKKVRTQADVVVVSFHWGVHHVHAVIATYQKEVAHAVIDAGADLILGHHAHLPKGIEVYKGKPIFYSMGNFAFDMPMEVFSEHIKHSETLAKKLKNYGWKPDPEYDVYYGFVKESRKSMIVRCNIVDKKIQRVSFLPVLINQKAQPRVVTREDKNFEELFEYVKEITEDQELKAEFSMEGNEIVVSLT
jgi:poly-gamma-glutamate capsule biosynthesis protein CapA/YwtB (metallophosphatase superfamily)